MANFAQTQQVQYRDYVATQPIEAQTLVGTQREQELKAGIQKVNDYVTRVAGVDVARDSDKKYIQDRLNSLKEGVTKNLSGDFSNSRIVNQITGAASQIYKDPVVQNAIMSTVAVRSGQQEMDSARKEGKNGPSNDWKFNQNVQKYVTDPNADATFNYKYEQYTDTRKEVAEIVDKMVNASGYSTDEAYHYVTDKETGKTSRVLNESTIRNGFKGVKPDQIKAALRANLSPQAWRQYELDGEYQYSNVPDPVFVNQVNTHYTEIADKYKEKLRLLSLAPTTSAEEKSSMESSKVALEKELDSLKEEYDGVVSTFATGDTASAKARLYTLNKINHLASSLSYGEVVSQYVGDTPQQMEKWRQEKGRDWDKFMLTYNQNAEFHADDMLEKRLTREQKDKEGMTLGSLGTPLSKSAMPSISLDRFTEMAGEQQKAINAERNAFISRNNLDPNSKAGQDWYNERAAAYRSKSPLLDAFEFNHFRAMEMQQREHDGDLQVATELKTKYENSGIYKKIEDFLPAGEPNVVYQEDPTHSWTFTPKDFVEFNEVKKKYRKVTGNPATGGSSVVYDWAGAKKDLGAKQLKLLEMDSKPTQSTAERKITNYAQKYNEMVNIPHGKEVAKMGEDLEKELNSRIQITQSSVKGVPITNPAQKWAADQVLADLAIYANEHNGKIGNTTSDELLALTKDENKTISFQTSPGNRYQEAVSNMIVTGADKSIHIIPLEEEQRRNVFGNSFDASPVEKGFDYIERQITKAGGYSTQLGPTPFLGKSDFSSVINYGIEGNVEKDGDSYMMRLSIFDPVEKKWVRNIPYPSSSVTDKGGVLNTLSGLNDIAIFNLLHGNKTPTAQDLEALQKAAQKHF